MKTNVKNYTNDDLIGRMKTLPSFMYVPKGLHKIVVRSKEDEPDKYDDKAYLFLGKRSLMVLPCTTHAGLKALKNPFRYNKKGIAVVKSDEIYYNALMKSDGKYVRHHNGKMKCLRQIAPMKYYRDGNSNDKIDETGEIYEGNYSTNVHANSYNSKSGIVSRLIGAWSYGCVVINDLTKYYQMLELIPYNQPITLTVLKEF